VALLTFVVLAVCRRRIGGREGRHGRGCTFRSRVAPRGARGDRGRGGDALRPVHAKNYWKIAYAGRGDSVVSAWYWFSIAVFIAKAPGTPASGFLVGLGGCSSGARCLPSSSTSLRWGGCGFESCDWIDSTVAQPSVEIRTQVSNSSAKFEMGGCWAPIANNSGKTSTAKECDRHSDGGGRVRLV